MPDQILGTVCLIYLVFNAVNGGHATAPL